jgi:hypothetical protein
MALSALSREDLSVSRILVGRWNLRLLKHDILDPYAQAVLAIRVGAVIAIEKSFRANIGQTMGEQAGLAVVTEEAIEGLDMRVHGQLKGRVGCVIGRRVSEQRLTTESVELMVPVGFGSRRGHGGRY